MCLDLTITECIMHSIKSVPSCPLKCHCCLKFLQKNGSADIYYCKVLQKVMCEHEMSKAYINNETCNKSGHSWQINEKMW